MRQVGISPYLSEFDNSYIKVCSSNTNSKESIFSKDIKICGSGLVGTALLDFIIPSGKSGALSVIKGLNIIAMSFCVLGLLTACIRKIVNIKKEENKSDKTSPEQKKPVYKEKSTVEQQVLIVKTNSAPKTDVSAYCESISEKPKTHSGNFRIAVIDDYQNNDNNCGKLKHGDIVTNIISSKLPNAIIEKKDLSNFLGSLDDIIDNVNKGVHYDAINLSCTYDFFVDFDQIKIFDKNNKRIVITKDNVDKYKMEIKQFIEDKAKQEGAYEYSVELLKRIEYLTDRKIPVFLSNNNNSGKSITLSDVWDFNSKYENNNNPYLITVSASDKIAKHSKLSDTHEKATLKLVKIHSGIDYTGDGKADVKNPYNIRLLTNKNSFEGNSFATPFALVNHLIG